MERFALTIRLVTQDAALSGDPQRRMLAARERERHASSFRMIMEGTAELAPRDLKGARRRMPPEGHSSCGAVDVIPIVARELDHDDFDDEKQIIASVRHGLLSGE